MLLSVPGRVGLRPEDTAAPLHAEKIFHYIYAVLHSPAYRQRYAAFLRTDFPRIPIPGSRAVFDALASLGAQLADRSMSRRYLALAGGAIVNVPAGLYRIDGQLTIAASRVVLMRRRAISSTVSASRRRIARCSRRRVRSERPWPTFPESAALPSGNAADSSLELLATFDSLAE